MTSLNGQASSHVVDEPAPLVPTRIEYTVLRFPQPDGTVVVRIVFKKPGHAMTVDFVASDCETFENNVRASRVGLVLPG